MTALLEISFNVMPGYTALVYNSVGAAGNIFDATNGRKD